MIGHPLGVRLDPDSPPREQIRLAATLGAKGVVVEAAGDLTPERLGESGRREVRHLLRSVELSLTALALPTRTPFDRIDNLEARLARADRVFAMAYELETRLVLARVGPVPPESDSARRTIFGNSLAELARKADHRGVRLAIETGTEAGSALAAFLESQGSPSLAASIEPASLLARGVDPVVAVRELGRWVAHAYATEAVATSARDSIAPNPRGMGFRPGRLDWPEYIGSLEEINYRGFLTAWPAPGALAEELPAIVRRLKQL